VNPGPPGELWIDFQHLQAVIEKLVEAFEEYMGHRRSDRFEPFSPTTK